ncbi:bifunctional RNase H/acid phosphatase [Angustibacter sp. McL0619]|uniref:bifunctional RNase H/acid phosphatase n=1 Tax=Angustibacter sp. McL0619 TaxID=3415676 RepID=UPI003CF0006A
MTRRFVVEADGGSRGNPGPAAYGALVRDAETGEVLAERAEAIGVASNNVAEYGGLVAGLEAAVALDPDCRIEVRMDSKLVVEQMSGRWKVKHEDMRRLFAQARQVVDPARVSYVWVPRERNKEADRLVNEAMDDAARGLPWRGSGLEGGAPVAVKTVPPVQPDAVGGPPIRTGPPDVGTAATLVLLRHGVTAHTVDRRFSGSGGEGPALTELGRDQAAAAAEVLVAVEPFDAVVASPMLRAQQTAEVVAARLGLDVRTEPAWTECEFGDWEGLTTAEVSERWPQEYRAWLDSTAVPPPGGESFDELDGRVLRVRDRTIARHPRGRVLVVTHAGPIKTLAREALGAAATVVWRMESSPASLSTTRWWSDGGSSLVSFNETGHLTTAGLALR